MPVQAPGIDRFKPGHIEVFSDFLTYLTGAVFTTIASNSGAVAAEDTEGGVALLEPSDGTVADNDETYIHTKKVFKFGMGRGLYFGARLAIDTADNLNDSNFIAGFSSTTAADAVQDDGDGPPASYSGAVFFKADGAASIFFEVSIGTTQITSAAVGTIADNVFQNFEIIGRPNLTTEYRVYALIDGVPVGTDDQQVNGFQIDPTNAAVMGAIAGIKLGAATNHDKMRVDWLGARQTRVA